MNENRRPQRGDADRRRPGRGPQERVVEEVEGQLEGRNAVQEALKSGRTIDKVFVGVGTQTAAARAVGLRSGSWRKWRASWRAAMPFRRL